MTNHELRLLIEQETGVLLGDYQTSLAWTKAVITELQNRYHDFSIAVADSGTLVSGYGHTDSGDGPMWLVIGSWLKHVSANRRAHEAKRKEAELTKALARIEQLEGFIRHNIIYKCPPLRPTMSLYTSKEDCVRDLLIWNLTQEARKLKVEP